VVSCRHGTEIGVNKTDRLVYKHLIIAAGAILLLAGSYPRVISAQGSTGPESRLAGPAAQAAVRDFIPTRLGAVPPTGDTLTVIQRPLLNIPAFVKPGDTLVIECDADPTAFDWVAELVRNHATVPLDIAGSAYDPLGLQWMISAVVPDSLAHGLYDLVVDATRAIRDTTRHAVQVIPEFKDQYYFIHITDTHLPTHLYYYQYGARTDTSEIADLHQVIADINIINPEFVLLTGDLHQGPAAPDRV
jgi:hypothetical protein